jgi:hypothetical protein
MFGGFPTNDALRVRYGVPAGDDNGTLHERQLEEAGNMVFRCCSWRVFPTLNLPGQMLMAWSGERWYYTGIYMTATGEILPAREKGNGDAA